MQLYAIIIKKNYNDCIVLYILINQTLWYITLADDSFGELSTTRHCLVTHCLRSPSTRGWCITYGPLRERGLSVTITRRSLWSVKEDRDVQGGRIGQLLVAFWIPSLSKCETHNMFWTLSNRHQFCDFPDWFWQTRA
jgi:hypothetical protein